MAELDTPTREQVLAYLEKNAPDVAKLVAKDLTAGDVHATTALGNGNDDDEEKPVAALLDAARLKVKPIDVDKKGDVVEWKAAVAITKLSPDKQMIFGWASVTEIDGKDVVDKQDDVIKTEDLEAAAYDFVLYSRQHGDMHVKKGTGRMIESMVFTPEKAEKGLIALDPATGQQLFGWFTGWKVDEPKVWDAYKRGERPELSIGGKGIRVPV